MPKFLADAMVGNVARYLRILGCDTEYYPYMAQDSVVKYAAATNRVILTKNKKLSSYNAKRNVVTVYAPTEHTIMKKVIHDFDISVKISAKKSRCSICNGKQKNIDEKNYRCVSCGKIYWDGTHLDNMRGMTMGWRDI